MNTFSLPVETEDKDCPMKTVSEPFGERVCQSGERIGVSQFLLSGAWRDQAIELAELLETKFELQGKHVQAAYAAHLRRQLEASREGVRT